MKILLILAIFFIQNNFAQEKEYKLKDESEYRKDTLLIVKYDHSRGYDHSFILYIPQGTPRNERIPLLVEPNNTGFTSDSIEVHLYSAIELASKSSVGNNVSRLLKIPLLVPVFPRPSSQQMVYTHSLDRDVMLERNSNLERLDLQLISIINEAKEKLKSLDVTTEEKVFMTGFSASGTFVNRFALIHPGIIKALATGGLNSKLILPLTELGGYQLDYPLGINDFQKVTGKTFDFKTYKNIPQFIYMGKLDDNDAVKFNDAYSPKEREIIYSVIGEDMQTRWKNSQEIYNQNIINVQFRTYEEVGHWTTSEMLWEIIKFFQEEM